MSAVKAVRFDTSQEDVSCVVDLEDLLSPRPQESTSINVQEEKSDPVDYGRLAQMPQSQPLQVTSRDQGLSAAPMDSKRLWLFSPEPPSFSQILSSSHDLGVDLVQVRKIYICLANHLTR